MKKVENKFIVVYAALGTYFFVIGTALVLNAWAIKAEAHNIAVEEAMNTAEDVIYWISEDVKSGYVDSVKADSYIDNLEQMIKELE